MSATELKLKIWLLDAALAQASDPMKAFELHLEREEAFRQLLNTVQGESEAA